MQNPLFKLTALASVIGAGMTVVYEAQQHLGQAGSVEQFAELSEESSSKPTADEGETPTAIASPEKSPAGDFLFAQTEPGEASGPTNGDDIVARGPAPSTLEPGPEPMAFLYGNSEPKDGAATPPSQVEPLVTAALDAEPQPTEGVAQIQLLSDSQPAAESPEPTGLKPFPVDGGAPRLLTPPSTPPMPPRPGEESSFEPEAAASNLVRADFNVVQNEFADMVKTVSGTVAEVEAVAGEAEGTVNELLAQADPFPTASPDRTRAPVPAAPPLNQDEPADLFGPLPTTDPKPAPIGNSEPNADILVLPANSPTAAAGADPFTPSAIPGTGPGEPDFLPEAAPTRTPTPTSPPLFPEVSPTPTTPRTNSAGPGTAPIEDLFLPEEPAPAGSNPGINPLVFPAGSPTASGGDDPFGPLPTTAAPTPVPTPSTASSPKPTAAVPPPPDRSRSVPTPVPSTATPQPTAESPFFTTEPTPSNLPRRTAEPTPANDPFPVFPEPAPVREPQPSLAFPEPTAAPGPSYSNPAPSSLPGFPTSNDLSTPTTTPSRSSIPATSPTPSLTFPERGSIPTAPARSTLPDFNATTSPMRSTVDPLPRTNDLTGTGLFDSTAPAGLQPELQIEKDAPPKAVLNQPLVYNIRVRNVGRSAAHQVIVEDGIPKGSRLEGTNPEAELDPTDKHLIWRIGTLAPAEERLIRVKIIPIEPGEIGSVATVRFTGRIAAKTIITAPKIRLEMNGPAETAVGDVPVYRFRVSNVGDGDATNVIVKSALPNVFEHPSGRELEYSVGALGAGQSRDLELALSAVKPGQASQAFVALLDDQEHDRAAADVVVLASRISIERTGPERRFVNRPANYVTQVTNQSSEPLQNVTVVETLPAGMELAAVPQHGRYDPARRTITWVIRQLGPQETQQLQSSLVTADQGAYMTKVQVWDAAGNKAEAASQLEVAGFSALRIGMAQTTQGGGEVAVGDQVGLRLTVANQGSAAANDVVMEFEIPPELEFVAARPQQYELVNGKVRFQAIPRLDRNDSQVIDIVCVARQQGRPQIAANIWSKEQENPIRQAEAVVVFAE